MLVDSRRRRRRRGSFVGVWYQRREIDSLVMIGTRAPRIVFSPSIGTNRKEKTLILFFAQVLRRSGAEEGAFQ